MPSSVPWGWSAPWARHAPRQWPMPTARAPLRRTGCWSGGSPHRFSWPLQNGPDQNRGRCAWPWHRPPPASASSAEHPPTTAQPAPRVPYFAGQIPPNHAGWHPATQHISPTTRPADRWSGKARTSLAASAPLPSEPVFFRHPTIRPANGLRPFCRPQA